MFENIVSWFNEKVDRNRMVKDFNYKPTMSVKKGVENFIKWYKSYYDNINQ